MARSFSYDHYRDNKRDDRSALRQGDYRAFTQQRPESEREEGPLHGRGAQARTREMWRKLHEGERQQRATAEARASRVPIGALPPHEELPDEVEAAATSGSSSRKQKDIYDRTFEGLEGKRGVLGEARARWGTLHRSLGEAAGAFARLLRLPMDVLRPRGPQAE